MIYINVYQIKFISNKGIKSQQKNLPRFSFLTVLCSVGGCAPDPNHTWIRFFFVYECIIGGETWELRIRGNNDHIVSKLEFI